MNADVTLGTTDSEPLVPSPPFRDTLAEAARAHEADLKRRRNAAFADSRPLTLMEERRLGEVASNICCHMKLPSCFVMADEWRQAMEGFFLKAFRIRTLPGPRIHALPGRYILRETETHERDWLETAVVEAMHVEACASRLGKDLELSPPEVALATQRYRTVAPAYERIVRATGIYNVLSWWFTQSAHETLDARYEEQCIQAASLSLEAHLTSTSEVPVEEQQAGPFILPRGRFAGEALTPTRIREVLVGDRFPRALRGLA